MITAAEERAAVGAAFAVPETEKTVAAGVGGDVTLDNVDNAFLSAALDWPDSDDHPIAKKSSDVDAAERGGVIDDAVIVGDAFEENASDAKAMTPATQIQLTPTWLSSESDNEGYSSPLCNEDHPPRDDSESKNISAVDNDPRNINADRLWKVIIFMAAALVVFVVITITLSISLAIVATKDDANNEETPTVFDPASAMDETVVEPSDTSLEPDETLFSDSGTIPFVSSTAPTHFPISHVVTDIMTPIITKDPTTSPSTNPTNRPSFSPSIDPTNRPTNRPTYNPSNIPSSAPIDPFFFGDLSVANDGLGIEVSAGLSVKLLATAGERVSYSDYGQEQESEEDFHDLLDAAAIIPLKGGGYVYVSNSERANGKGGVYGLYFDEFGNITEYKALLDETTDNCGGGLTPWNTWISCEEYDDGQCWQIDPDPSSPNHDNPKSTTLGGEGGRYESVAVDNRTPERPVFFVTEDESDGALRRVEIDGTGWDSLHREDAATTSFLRILDDSRFGWTVDEDDAKDSAEEYYPNSEGISFHEEEGRLYFMSKELKSMLVLDLKASTYESETTGKKFYGEGSFAAQPDQSIFGPRRRHMYFTEDGGSTPGVYARLGSTGTYYTMFQAISKDYDGDETVGVALSPDGKKFYAGIQDVGVLFEFSRDDGLPFE